MDLNFQPITLGALPVLTQYLPAGGTGDCSLSPTALVCTAADKQSCFAVDAGRLYIRWRPRPEMPEVFCWPIGPAPAAQDLEEFEDFLLSTGREVLLYGSVPDIIRDLGATLPYRNFTVYSSNGWWDYLYDRETLATLAGRRLHRKRNFVRRFYSAHPDVRAEPLGAGHRQACLDFLDAWLEGRGPSADLQAEKASIRFAFDHMDEFALTGAVLTDGKALYGFSYGALCAPGVFAVHIEKADKDCVGAYPALSSALAAMLPESVSTLNREEDLGVCGLRKAKQDWAPRAMLQKGFVRLLPGMY